MATFFLYGTLYEWNSLPEFLKEHSGENVTIRFNSPGGNVMTGLALYNLVKSHKGKVTGIIDGECSSAATLIFCGCKERITSSNGLMLIHGVSTFAEGKKENFEKYIEQIEMIENQIVNIYKQTIGEDKEKQILKLMQEERYINSDEMVELGFAEKKEDVVYLDKSLFFSNMINNSNNKSDLEKLQLLQKENEQLKQENEQLKQEKIEELVKKAPQNLQPSIRLLAKMNYQEAENMVKELGKSIYSNVSIVQQIQNQSQNARTEWTLKDWRKNDPEGLKRLKIEEPELFENLLKTV